MDNLTLELVAGTGFRFWDGSRRMERDSVRPDGETNVRGGRGDNRLDRSGSRLNCGEFSVGRDDSSPKDRLFSSGYSGELDAGTLELREQMPSSLCECAPTASGTAALVLDKRSEGVFEFDDALLGV
jgi:hypothetical protein